jgi:hypothetical protein
MLFIRKSLPVLKASILLLDSLNQQWDQDGNLILIKLIQKEINVFGLLSNDKKALQTLLFI